MERTKVSVPARRKLGTPSNVEPEPWRARAWRLRVGHGAAGLAAVAAALAAMAGLARRAGAGHRILVRARTAPRRPADGLRVRAAARRPRRRPAGRPCAVLHLDGLRGDRAASPPAAFDLWSQAMHMLPVFFLAQLVTQIILAWLAGKWPGWQWAVSVGLTVAIWPLAGWVLHAAATLRRRPIFRRLIRADACSIQENRPAQKRAFACAPGWAACSRWPASACWRAGSGTCRSAATRGFRAGGRGTVSPSCPSRRGEARSWTATAKSGAQLSHLYPGGRAGPGRQPGPAVRSPGAGRVHQPVRPTPLQAPGGRIQPLCQPAAAQQPQRHRGRLVLGAFVRVPGRRAACALGA